MLAQRPVILMRICPGFRTGISASFSTNGAEQGFIISKNHPKSGDHLDSSPSVKWINYSRRQNVFGDGGRHYLRTSAVLLNDGEKDGGKNEKKNNGNELQEADPHGDEQQKSHVFAGGARFRDTVERLEVQNNMSNISLGGISASNMQGADGTPQNGPKYEGHQYTYGSVSLSGVMESNVPEPYQTSKRGSPSHMNMPGGGANQQDKFVAGQIKDTHPTRKYSTSSAAKLEDHSIDFQGIQGSTDQNVEQLVHADNPCPEGIQGDNCERFKLWLNNCIRYGNVSGCNQDLASLKAGRKTLSQIFEEQEKLIASVMRQPRRTYSTSSRRASAVDGNASSKDSESDAVSRDSRGVSQKDRLKRAVKEYGGTVVVFHVAISLMSLGTAYLAVSSGVDMVALLEKLGFGQSMLESRLAAGTSTFVVAYAVHKVFAPVRIATTLTATPLIVRGLRRAGVLRPPPQQS